VLTSMRLGLTTIDFEFQISDLESRSQLCSQAPKILKRVRALALMRHVNGNNRI
jgi:hypothetical protein